ncbi:hypothetical protein CVT26_005419, partial [Gymnopilus dilepis]
MSATAVHITSQSYPFPATPHGPSHSNIIGTATTSHPANASSSNLKTSTTLATPSSSSTSPYRLLYRGAISLPDSLLLLDGLTFAARLGSGSPSKSGGATNSNGASTSSSSNNAAAATFQLLDNPLALALESMRGRPTLRFVGVVKLQDVFLDESGGVEMDIHPAAVLSQIYFENMFCLLPFPSPSAAPETRAERSEIGIRVALGDSNGPETTHIVIFAQLVPASAPTPTLSSSSTPQQTITLRVGRITPKPPSPQTLKKRPPRPDDPIPRKPPAFFIRDGGGVRKAGSVGNVLTVGAGERGKDALKRVASATAAGVAKKQKVSSSSAVADLGSGVRLGAAAGNGNGAAGDEGVFKVPELPNRTKASAKGKEKEREKEKEKDVFGDVSEVRQNGSAQAASLNGKAKQDGKNGEDAAAAAFEKANKNLIKSQTLAYLARTKDPADPSRVIDKAHPEFRE